MAVEVSGKSGGLEEWPVAAATAASAQESATFRTDFGCEVTEGLLAAPAMRVLHPGLGFPEDDIKPPELPIRIRRGSHGVGSENQSFDGHHFVELAAWPDDVVVSGRLVIVVAPRGVRMDFIEARVVLDAHHGAHGEDG